MKSDTDGDTPPPNLGAMPWGAQGIQGHTVKEEKEKTPQL